MTVKVTIPKGSFVSEVYAIDTERHELLVWNTVSDCFSWIPTYDLVDYDREGSQIIRRHTELVR